MTTLTICVSFCVPALFQHCFSASVFAFVSQQFTFVLRQFTFVLQRVSASVLQKQSIAINDNLDHLHHLCCSHISNTCDQCGLWLERYYLDVPKLQSKIHDLENQVAKLTGQNEKEQPNDKKQRTTGSILFKNVESTTAIVNSKLT